MSRREFVNIVFHQEVHEGHEENAGRSGRVRRFSATCGFRNSNSFRVGCGFAGIEIAIGIEIGLYFQETWRPGTDFPFFDFDSGSDGDLGFFQHGLMRLLSPKKAAFHQ